MKESSKDLGPVASKKNKGLSLIKSWQDLRGAGGSWGQGGKKDAFIVVTKKERDWV